MQVTFFIFDRSLGVLHLNQTFMKSPLILLCLIASISCYGQRGYLQPKPYAFHLGGTFINLIHYQSQDKQYYGGGGAAMELPFAERWTVGFSFNHALFKDNQKPYNNSVAVWKETLQAMSTDFRFYPKSRYKGFFMGVTEGLTLRKIDALVPLENDATNRNTRIPFNERLNSFALGINTGYSLAIKKDWLITLEAKALAQRSEWMYQIGISGGFRFR